MKESKEILVASIVSVKGLKGQVKLNCFFNDLEVIKNNSLFCKSNNNYYKIIDCYVQGSQLIANFENINSIEQAKQLVGIDLYIARELLPKINHNDTYYASDLINSKVLTSGGSVIGVVNDVQNYGAGDILQIELSAGDSKMLSFNNNSVVSVDLLKHTVTINPEYLV